MTVVNNDVWQPRVAELKAAEITGACFYTDGGMRSVRGVDTAGYGIHAYFFNDKKPEGLGGFKINHPTNVGYVEKKAASKDNVVNVVKFWNAYGRIGKVTNQVAELEAFIKAADTFLEAKLYEFIKTLIVRTDSMYVVEGINTHLKSWVGNNWRKANGGPVKNIDCWKRVHRIVESLKGHGIVLDLAHVYGHEEDTGNNIADQMATLGLYQTAPYGDDWIDRADYNAAMIYLHPLFLESKLLYYPEINVKSMVDGKYYHLIYNNNCSQDEINDIGRNLIDSSIGFIIRDEKDIELDNFYKSCKRLNEVYDRCPKVVDLSVTTKPNIQIELREENIGSLPAIVGRKEIKINTINEKTAFYVLNPPRNSGFTLSNIHNLLDKFRKNEAGVDDSFRSIDITDLLFDLEVNGKGVTKHKFKVTEAFHIDVDLPFAREGLPDLKVKTALTFGLDLPRRRVFSNLKEHSPRVIAFTWTESNVFGYFASAVYVDGAVGVWSSEHTNVVLLTEEP